MIRLHLEGIGCPKNAAKTMTPELNYPRLEGEGFAPSQLEADSEATPARPRRIPYIFPSLRWFLKDHRKDAKAQRQPVLAQLCRNWFVNCVDFTILFFALRRGVSTIPEVRLRK